MSDGLTYEELGQALFASMKSETKYSLACPFGNGLADFIGRDNNTYAKKFCARGCSPDCYWEMIRENRKRYDCRILALQESEKDGQTNLHLFEVKE